MNRLSVHHLGHLLSLTHLPPLSVRVAQIGVLDSVNKSATLRKFLPTSRLSNTSLISPHLTPKRIHFLADSRMSALPRDDLKMSQQDDQENKSELLLALWDRLMGVTHLTMLAKTKSNEKGKGWNGTGQGEVVMIKEGSNIIIFHEKGSWQGARAGEEISFTNVFRWTLDRATGVISLEHLRRGRDHPVFLFHLAPSGPHTLSSVDAHLCENDTYAGQIHFDDRSRLRMTWRVLGPNKNEELDYVYS